MKGADQVQPELISTITLECFVDEDHKLREIRRIANKVLLDMEPEFVQLYSAFGRASIPPEMLLRALLLMALYSVPSERRLMEHLRYNLLFRWFVGLNATDSVWDASTFSKNRERLLTGEIARLFFDGVRSHAAARRLMSSDHFTVDGTLIEAWASHKSVRPIQDEGAEAKKEEPKDPPASGSSFWVDFHGEKRSNQTHRSATDPEARLARKGSGKEAKLCFSGHVLMENRNGLIVDVETTLSTGTAEVEASLTLLERNASSGSTVGADKLYDQTKFVEGCRKHGITAHVAQNVRNRKSRIDARTTRTAGYEISQKKRKRIEEIFGWQKSTGGLRRMKYRGLKRVNEFFVFCGAVFNLLRMANIAQTQPKTA